MSGEPQDIVVERVNIFNLGGRADPALILADDVTEAAAELWRSAIQTPPAGAVPYEVVRTLALFHWNRHDAAPNELDLYDLQVAAVMFAHIFKVDPESTPEQLRGVLANEVDVMFIQGELGPPAWSSVEISYRGSTDAGLLNHKVRNGPDWQMREASTIYRRANTDETADLDRAIFPLREATGVMPHDDQSSVSGLSNLVQAPGTTFQATRGPG